MDRRGFLKWVGGATAVGAAGVLVPEAIGEGVWRQIKSYFFLGNSGAVHYPLMTADLVALQLEKVRDKLPLLFERVDSLYWGMSRKINPDAYYESVRRETKTPLVFNPKFHRPVDRAIKLNESLEESDWL